MATAVVIEDPLEAAQKSDCNRLPGTQTAFGGRIRPWSTRVGTRPARPRPTAGRAAAVPPRRSHRPRSLGIAAPPGSRRDWREFASAPPPFLVMAVVAPARGDAGRMACSKAP